MQCISLMICAHCEDKSSTERQCEVQVLHSNKSCALLKNLTVSNPILRTVNRVGPKSSTAYAVPLWIYALNTHEIMNKIFHVIIWKYRP